MIVPTITGPELLGTKYPRSLFMDEWPPSPVKSTPSGIGGFSGPPATAGVIEPLIVSSNPGTAGNLSFPLTFPVGSVATDNSPGGAQGTRDGGALSGRKLR